jgi:hypothetical protein
MNAIPPNAPHICLSPFYFSYLLPIGLPLG